MQRFALPILAAFLLAGGALIAPTTSFADEHEEEKPEPVTITGRSACASCSSEVQGHDVMLYTEGGIRIVLKGEGPNYKAAHEVRREGKTMTATLAGPITAKKDGADQPYLEAKVAKIEIKS